MCCDSGHSILFSRFPFLVRTPTHASGAEMSVDFLASLTPTGWLRNDVNVVVTVTSNAINFLHSEKGFTKVYLEKVYSHQREAFIYDDKSSTLTFLMFL